MAGTSPEVGSASGSFVALASAVCVGAASLLSGAAGLESASGSEVASSVGDASGVAVDSTISSGTGLASGVVASTVAGSASGTVASTGDVFASGGAGNSSVSAALRLPDRSSMHKSRARMHRSCFIYFKPPQRDRGTDRDPKYPILHIIHEKWMERQCSLRFLWISAQMKWERFG